MSELSVTCSGCFQAGPAWDRGFALTQTLRLYLDGISIRSASHDFDRIDLSPCILPDREDARPWITYSKKYRTIRVSEAIDYDTFVHSNADHQANLFAKAVASSIRRIKPAIVASDVAEGLVQSLTRAITSHGLAVEG